MSVCAFVLTYSMGVLCKHLDWHTFFCKRVFVKAKYVNAQVMRARWV